MLPRRRAQVCDQVLVSPCLPWSRSQGLATSYGGMSESFYPGVEDGDLNSGVEKIEEIAGFEVIEEHISI